MTVYINGRRQGNTSTPAEIRDALLSLPDNERVFITSEPNSGERRVIEIHKAASGNMKYDYESEPEP